VVLSVRVHFPYIECDPFDISRREQRRHYRVILVVVLVHAIAAGDLEIGEPREATADFGEERKYRETGTEVAGVPAD
jgi:hypothetical protein